MVLITGIVFIATMAIGSDDCTLCVVKKNNEVQFSCKPMQDVNNCEKSSGKRTLSCDNATVEGCEDPGQGGNT